MIAHERRHPILERHRGISGGSCGHQL